jgi:hypothetical protein
MRGKCKGLNANGQDKYCLNVPADHVLELGRKAKIVDNGCRICKLKQEHWYPSLAVPAGGAPARPRPGIRVDEELEPAVLLAWIVYRMPCLMSSVATEKEK